MPKTPPPSHPTTLSYGPSREPSTWRAVTKRSAAMQPKTLGEPSGDEATPPPTRVRKRTVRGTKTPEPSPLRKVIFSIDVETDGPDLFANSMRSIGVVMLYEGTVFRQQRWNLRPLPDRTFDPATMQFWAKNPEAFGLITKDAREAEEVMPEIDAWMREGLKHLVCRRSMAVYWPASFDSGWVNAYFQHFVGRLPCFGQSACDMKSLVAGVLGMDYMALQKTKPPFNFVLPDLTEEEAGLKHDPVFDARLQGLAFARLERLRYGSEDWRVWL